MQVQILALPIPGLMQYFVEDTPSSRPVAGISHGGQYNPLTGTIKFGPFTDDQPRTLTYQLVVPPGTAGWIRFSGSASAEDIKSSVVGDDVLRIWEFPPPSLWVDLRWRPLTGNMVLQITGGSPALYAIETSPDLVQWDTMATTTNSSSFIEFPISWDATPGGRFYQARPIQ